MEDEPQKRDFERMAGELNFAARIDRTALAEALYAYYDALKAAGFSVGQAYELVKWRGLDQGNPLPVVVLGAVGEDDDRDPLRGIR